MGTPSNYRHNTPSNRKQTVKWLNEQTTFWHKYTDKCWYDDGHDESDVNDIICSIRDGIDQGTSKTLRDYVKSGSVDTPVRRLKVPKWIPFEPKEPTVKKATVREHYIDMPDVTRVIPKVELPKPYVPPKRYTAEEDCIEVERWIVIIESVDNMNIIRTEESVRNIAKWIREDEHINYRYKRPISCNQVREILKEFEK